MQARHRLRAWLIDETLPIWLDSGCDRDFGGFHEKLNFDFTPIIEEGKRSLVQARQCFVYAWASDFLPGAAEMAGAGFDFLVSYGRHLDGGWRHRMTRDGQPLDDSRDLYDQAFVIFAAAALHRYLGRTDALAVADETLAYLDQERVHPAGGYSEIILPDGNVADTPRRQNPHMHLFEAVVALYEATGNTAYLDRAAGLYDLLCEKFLLNGTLREYFTDGLAPAPGAAGRIVEPGHHLEWVWLLHRFAALSGDNRAVSVAGTLYDFAIQYGYDAPSGGLFDEVSADGTVYRDDRRLWPQTEALKAHAARIEHVDDRQAMARIEAGAATLLRDHLVGQRGGWREHIHSDGENFYKSYPASSLYHLSFAVAELDRVLADA